MAETPPTHPSPLPPPHFCPGCGMYGDWHAWRCPHRPRKQHLAPEWPVILIIALVAVVVIGTLLVNLRGLFH